MDGVVGRGLVGRIGYLALLPSLVLPAAVAVAAQQGAHAYNDTPRDELPSDGAGAAFTNVPILFCFILLLSMTVNAILLLSSGAVRPAGRLPARTASSVLAIDAVLLLWIWPFAVEAQTGRGGNWWMLLHLLFWAALIALSILVFVDAVKLRRAGPAPGLRVRTLVVALTAVVLLGSGAIATNWFTSIRMLDSTFAGDVLQWSLILLGLPFSFVLAAVGPALAAVVEAQGGLQGGLDAGVVVRLVLSLGPVAVALTAAVMLIRTIRRARETRP